MWWMARATTGALVGTVVSGAPGAIVGAALAGAMAKGFADDWAAIQKLHQTRTVRFGK
jgi:hypothetical protein